MKDDKPSPSAAASPLDWPFEAGVVDRVLEKVDLKVKQRKRRRRRQVTGSIAALLVFAFVNFWAIPFARDTATIATLPAQPQQLTLADGSTAELNAQTSMRTDFRYGRRIVQLDRGEAFFSVAKDPAHPFYVETPHGTVRVTGTKFNVRLDAAQRPEVTLLEGGVQLHDLADEPSAAEKSSVVLVSGQQWTVAAGLRTLSSGELENLTSWRRGVLVLDGLTLAEVAERFASYHGVTIEVSPEAAKLHPGGSAPLNNLQAFLGAVQDTLPVRVISKTDTAFRIVPRGS